MTPARTTNGCWSDAGEVAEQAEAAETAGRDADSAASTTAPAGGVVGDGPRSRRQPASAWSGPGRTFAIPTRVDTPADGSDLRRRAGRFRLAGDVRLLPRRPDP